MLSMLYKVKKFHSRAEEIGRQQLNLDILMPRSFLQSSENEKWWESDSLEKTVETVVDASPLNVEITGYGLLIYVHRTLTQDAIPIMRWLVRQRNQHGGFQSTQVRHKEWKSNCLYILCGLRFVERSHSPFSVSARMY